MRQHLKEVEEEKKREQDRKKAEQEMATIMGSIKEFSAGIKSEIDQYGWLEKRSVIRSLVERIEVNLNSVTIVFRIKECIVQNGENQNIQPIMIRQRIVRPRNRRQAMYFEDE